MKLVPTEKFKKKLPNKQDLKPGLHFKEFDLSQVVQPGEFPGVAAKAAKGPAIPKSIEESLGKIKDAQVEHLVQVARLAAATVSQYIPPLSSAAFFEDFELVLEKMQDPKAQLKLYHAQVKGLIAKAAECLPVDYAAAIVGAVPTGWVSFNAVKLVEYLWLRISSEIDAEKIKAGHPLFIEDAEVQAKLAKIAALVPVYKNALGVKAKMPSPDEIAEAVCGVQPMAPDLAKNMATAMQHLQAQAEAKADEAFLPEKIEQQSKAQVLATVQQQVKGAVEQALLGELNDAAAHAKAAAVVQATLEKMDVVSFVDYEVKPGPHDSLTVDVAWKEGFYAPWSITHRLFVSLQGWKSECAKMIADSVTPQPMDEKKTGQVFHLFDHSKATLQGVYTNNPAPPSVFVNKHVFGKVIATVEDLENLRKALTYDVIYYVVDVQGVEFDSVTYDLARKELATLVDVLVAPFVSAELGKVITPGMWQNFIDAVMLCASRLYGYSPSAGGKVPSWVDSWKAFLDPIEKKNFIEKLEVASDEIYHETVIDTFGYTASMPGALPPVACMITQYPKQYGVLQFKVAAHAVKEHMPYLGDARVEVDSYLQHKFGADAKLNVVWQVNGVDEKVDELAGLITIPQIDVPLVEVNCQHEGSWPNGLHVEVDDDGVAHVIPLKPAEHVELSFTIDKDGAKFPTGTGNPDPYVHHHHADAVKNIVHPQKAFSLYFDVACTGVVDGVRRYVATVQLHDGAPVSLHEVHDAVRYRVAYQIAEAEKELGKKIAYNLDINVDWGNGVVKPIDQAGVLTSAEHAQVAASDIGQPPAEELVEVKPMDMPESSIFHLDYEVGEPKEKSNWPVPCPPPLFAANKVPTVSLATGFPVEQPAPGWWVGDDMCWHPPVKPIDGEWQPAPKLSDKAAFDLMFKPKDQFAPQPGYIYAPYMPVSTTPAFSLEDFEALKKGTKVPFSVGCKAAVGPDGHLVQESPMVAKAVLKQSAPYDPTALDDAAAGYTEGVFWYNQQTGKLFVCTKDDAGAAEWNDIGAVAPTAEGPKVLIKPEAKKVYPFAGSLTDAQIAKLYEGVPFEMTFDADQIGKPVTAKFEKWDTDVQTCIDPDAEKDLVAAMSEEIKKEIDKEVMQTLTQGAPPPTVQGAALQANHVDKNGTEYTLESIAYFQKKLNAALKVPPEYLGIVKNTK